MSKWRTIAVGAITAALALGVTVAADYIGADKCKMCHKVQFDSWKTLGHSKAFERLKPEEQGKAECLGCHATNKSATLPGVQCEACHGAGSDYKAMDVMKSREKSVAAGLILPDEKLCQGCHAGKAPHELPAFDFQKSLAGGVHAHKTAG